MALSAKDQAAVKKAAEAGGLKNVSVSSSGKVTASNSASSSSSSSAPAGSSASGGSSAPAPVAPLVIDSNLSAQDQAAVKTAYLAGGGDSKNISYSAPVVPPVTPPAVVPPVTPPATTPNPVAPITPASPVAPTDTPASTLPQISVNLGPGSSGTEVSSLQSWLLSQGYSIPSLQNGSAKPGVYGAETQAAVAQWQKDQEAKGNLKIPDPSQYGYFGPISRQALAAGGTPPTAPVTPTQPTTPTDTTGLGTSVDQEIAALRSAYGLGPSDPKKSVVQQAIDDYQAIYKALGVSDIKQSYTDAVDEFSKIQNELNDKITDIRDDPWLSQGVADARVASLTKAYETKLDIATNKMQLYDALTKEGIAQANDIVGRVHQIQSDNAAVVNQAIDIVQKKEDALNKLDTQVVEVGGHKLLIDSNTGNTIKDLGVVPKSGSSGTGTAAERDASQLAQFGAAFVPGAKLGTGEAVIDPNGYVTPAAWKSAIASYSGSRANFIKQFGYLLYSNGGDIDPAYGLTAVEQKIITGAL